MKGRGRGDKHRAIAPSASYDSVLRSRPVAVLHEAPIQVHVLLPPPDDHFAELLLVVLDLRASASVRALLQPPFPHPLALVPSPSYVFSFGLPIHSRRSCCRFFTSQMLPGSALGS